MPAWSGKCDAKPCTFTFDDVTAIVTPTGATPVAFDLGDIDRVIPGEWDIVLELYTGQKLQLSHFGAPFSDMSRDIFPFLPAVPLTQLQKLMPEGRSASLADLAAIDPRLPDALIARAVDEPLRPYFDALRQRATGPLFAGFKFIRPEDREDDREH